MCVCDCVCVTVCVSSPDVWCVFSVAERMETANKQLAARECEGSEDNRKTISQLLVQSEYHTHTHTHISGLEHSTGTLNIPPPAERTFSFTLCSTERHLSNTGATY